MLKYPLIMRLWPNIS